MRVFSSFSVDANAVHAANVPGVAGLSTGGAAV
jgi:hypothetical protein